MQATRNDKNTEAHRIASEMYQAADAAAKSWMQFRQDNDACGLAFIYIKGEIGAHMAAAGARLKKAGNGEHFAFVSCGNWQSLSALEHVGNAMIDSLKSNGVTARLESRMD